MSETLEPVASLLFTPAELAASEKAGADLSRTEARERRESVLTRFLVEAFEEGKKSGRTSSDGWTIFVDNKTVEGMLGRHVYSRSSRPGIYMEDNPQREANLTFLDVVLARSGWRRDGDIEEGFDVGSRMSFSIVPIGKEDQD